MRNNILLFISALIVLSCATPPRWGFKKDGSPIRNGWVDENTFRSEGTGSPRINEKIIAKRKEQSRVVAVIMAQKRIIESFTYRLPGGGNTVYNASMYIRLKEFGSMVKKGKVIYERYLENQNCEVVFQIQEKGLRKRAASGYYEQ